jgi:hypothetical protein
MKHLKRFNEDRGDILANQLELSYDIKETCNDILYDLEDDGIDCTVSIRHQFQGTAPFIYVIDIGIGDTPHECTFRTTFDLYKECKVIDRLTTYLKSEGFELGNIRIEGRPEMLFYHTQDGVSAFGVSYKDGEGYPTNEDKLWLLCPVLENLNKGHKIPMSCLVKHLDIYYKKISTT